jgi:hypothetical protein
MSTPRSRPPLSPPLQGHKPLTRAGTRLREAMERFVVYEKSAERQRSVRSQLVQEDESPSSIEPGESPRRHRTAGLSRGSVVQSEPNGSAPHASALYLGAAHACAPRKSLLLGSPWLESAPRQGARHRCTPCKGLRPGSPWLESLRLESTPQLFAPKIKPSANSHLKRTLPCLLSGTRLGKDCGMGRVSRIGFNFVARRGAGVACSSAARGPHVNPLGDGGVGASPTRRSHRELRITAPGPAEAERGLHANRSTELRLEQVIRDGRPSSPRSTQLKRFRNVLGFQVRIQVEDLLRRKATPYHIEHNRDRDAQSADARGPAQLVGRDCDTGARHGLSLAYRGGARDGRRLGQRGPGGEPPGRSKQPNEPSNPIQIVSGASGTRRGTRRRIWDSGEAQGQRVRSDQGYCSDSQ